MKIRVKLGDLVEQVTQVAITVDRKAPDMPIGKVYLRAKNSTVGDTEEVKSFLYLFSSNNASKTFIKLPIEAVETEGQTLIDAGKLLGSLVGRNPDAIVDLSVLADISKIRVKVGKNIANLPYDSAVDTAVAMIKALPKGEPIAKIPAKTLIEFIRRSLFCIPLSENGQQKFAMGVLNIKGADGKYVAQASDGRIIAWHGSKQSETTTYNLPSILVPLEALDPPLLRLLQRHKDVDVSLMEGARDGKGELQEIVFQMDDVQFGTVLRGGRYPNVATLIEQHAPDFVIQMNRDELKSALTRAANFVEDNKDKRYVKLSADVDNVIRIEAANPLSDLKDELDMSVSDGEFNPVSTIINIDYLANIAAVQTGELVSTGFSVAKDKALIVKDTSEAIDTKYAIMPIRSDKDVVKTDKKQTKKEKKSA